jgi:spermidine synthase
MKLRYYTPAVHRALFALPAHLASLFDSAAGTRI